MKKDLKVIGSHTAKAGFENEKGIIFKFNNWKTDKRIRPVLTKGVKDCLFLG